MKILKNHFTLCKSRLILYCAGWLIASCCSSNTESNRMEKWDTGDVQFSLKGETADVDTRTCLEEVSRGLIQSIQANTLVTMRVYVHRNHQLVKNIIDSKSLTITLTTLSTPLVHYSIAIADSFDYIVVHDTKLDRYSIRNLPEGMAFPNLKTCFSKEE